MFSSRKIFLIEDWFDYAMVTANLKYTKKKKQQQPCHEIEVPLKRKKTHTQKTTKQNKVNEENQKNKKKKQTNIKTK